MFVTTQKPQPKKLTENYASCWCDVDYVLSYCCLPRSYGDDATVTTIEALNNVCMDCTNMYEFVKFVCVFDGVLQRVICM